MSIRHKLSPAQYGGYTKLMFSSVKLKVGDEHHILLYAASTMGEFYLIDGRNGTTIKTYRGHGSSINWFVEVKSRGWIVTAGDDNICNVFQLET